MVQVVAGNDGAAGTPLTAVGRAAGRRGAREGGDEEAGRFPGPGSRPPGLSRSRNSGNDGTAGTPLTAVGRAAGRRGAREGGDEEAGRFPGGLAVGCPASRGPGTAATTARPVPRSGCSPGGGPSGCKGEGGDEETGRFPGGSAVGRRASRGPGTAATTERPVPRSGCSPGGGSSGCKGEGGDEEAGRFPGGSAVGCPASRGPGRVRGRGRSPPARGAPPWPAPGAPPTRGPLVTWVNTHRYRGGASGGALIGAPRRLPGAIPARPERGSVPLCPYCPCSSARRRGEGGEAGAGRPLGPGPVSVSPRPRSPGVTESAAIGSGVPVEGVSGTESRSGLAVTVRPPGLGGRSGRARGPHPRQIRTNGTSGGPGPSETAPEGPVLQREW